MIISMWLGLAASLRSVSLRSAGLPGRVKIMASQLGRLNFYSKQESLSLFVHEAADAALGGFGEWLKAEFVAVDR